MDYIIAHWDILLEGIILGFSVGLLTGVFGAGGGFIITPALNIFMHLPMNMAVGTSACQVLGASGFALAHNYNRKMKGIKVALLIGIGIPLGSYVGTAIVARWKQLPPLTIMGQQINAVNFILLAIFAGFLSLIAAWLLFDNFVLRRHQPENEENHVGLFGRIHIPPLMSCESIPGGEFSASVLVALGLFMGFISGLLGIGGGVIMMPMLFYLVGQRTKSAIITSTMLVFLSGLFATIFHAIDGNIDYILVGALIFGAFFGSKTGAAIHRKASTQALRKYFAFIVLAAAIMVVVKIIAMFTA